MPTILAFVPQGLLKFDHTARSSYHEVSTVQVIRMRINQQQVHKAKDLPSPTNGTYNHTGCHNHQAIYEGTCNWRT